MPSPSPAAISSRPIRDAIEFSRFSWIRPLLGAYVENFSSVAPLFAGDPGASDAWTRTIAAVQSGYSHRGLMSRVLNDQLERRGAPPSAREAARLLADPRTVAVVTGQQPGLFGGPLYTILKAATAIQIARDVTAKHGVPAVPIFWVDSEDHDWEEVRTAAILDRETRTSALKLADLNGAGRLQVGRLVIDANITGVLESLESLLQPTEFTAEVVNLLQRRYAPGVSMGHAFAGWLEDLLGSEGLVVFEADDVAAKPPAAKVFACEIENPARISGLVRQAADTMRRLGHQPQIEPADDSLCLFHLDGTGRRAIRKEGDRFSTGATSWSPAELTAEISAHPEHFSPNVALRPIVQDTLFPTVCYVAGPSELAYQAQLGPAYSACGATQPLLYPRASATILDAAAARFLEKHPISFESLQPHDEKALNRLLENQLPPEVDRGFHEISRVVSAEVSKLKDVIAGIDPTLAGAAETTSDRVAETLHTLHNKIVQAAKRRDETTRRQFTRTRALAFPDGQAQERLLSLPFFANRYGPAFARRLVDILPLATDKHYVVVL